MINKLLATGNDYGALIARLTLGIVMFPHGAQKVLGIWGGHGFAATMQNMSGMLPAPIVFLVILIEFAGALALIFGLLSRPAALGVLAVMLGAIVTVHGKFGFFMNWMGNQEGQGIEYHLLAIGLALIVIVLGGGAWSLDRAIAGAKK